MFSGRQIVLALLVIAAVSVILWIPVFSDQMMDFLSRTAPRYAPLTFLAGLGLLIIGLVAGVRMVSGALLLGLEGGVAFGTNPIQHDSSLPGGGSTQFTRVWSASARLGTTF